jgi:hypothetical protein
MKLKKTDVDFFLLQWIENDRILRRVLCQYEINILVDRIVKGKSLRRIAEKREVSIGVIHLGLETILVSIEEKVSEEAAKRLRAIDLRLRVKSSPFI